MAPFKKSGGLDAKSAAVVTPPSDVDDFSARRSSRVAAGRYAADNDQWVEALAVCEVPVKPGYGDAKAAAASKKKGGGGGPGLLRKLISPRNGAVAGGDAAGDATAAGSSSSPGEADVAAAAQRLTLRPYFQSRNTGSRVWDEPPSGASEILYATPEARKMARAQLEEMKSTYATAAAKRRGEREEKKEKRALAGGSAAPSPRGTGSKLIPSAFKRSSGAADAGQSSALLGKKDKKKGKKKGSGRVRGTLVLADEGGRRGIPKSVLEESKQLAGKTSYEDDLQKAMLMSMGVGGGSVMGVGDHKPRGRTPAHGGSTTKGGLTQEEEEELALAKALSMSEQEARQGRSTRRSKSSSVRRSESSKDGSSKGSNGSGGSAKQRRSKSQNGLPPPPPLDNQSSSFHDNNDYENMKPPPDLPSEYDANFDGGGKMPAAPRTSNHNKDDHNTNGLDYNDFGDRGSSWELSWSHSASPKNQDWAMS